MRGLLWMRITALMVLLTIQADHLMDYFFLMLQTLTTIVTNSVCLVLLIHAFWLTHLKYWVLFFNTAIWWEREILYAINVTISGCLHCRQTRRHIPHYLMVEKVHLYASKLASISIDHQSTDRKFGQNLGITTFEDEFALCQRPYSKASLMRGAMPT